MARSYTLVLVLAVVGLCSFASAADITPFELARAVIKMCVSELNVDKESLLTFAEKGTMPDDKKCLFKCMLQAVRGMDANGNLDKESISRFMPEERKPTVDQCIAESKGDADPCEKGFHFHVCFRKNQLEWYQASVKHVAGEGQL